MVLAHSSSMALGSKAPAFELPDTRSSESIALSQFEGQPLLVAFICNHCPYVVHLIDDLVNAAHDFAEQGIATVAISANDAQAYPADSPANMAKLAKAKQFGFAYCYDETQSVARAYDAVCTPDLYLFDRTHALFYRGQFDDSRPGAASAGGTHLRQAVSAMLDGHHPPENTRPSVGCSIKWKH